MMHTPAISADQLPVLPGMSLGNHLQVLHHQTTGLLGVELVVLDQIDRRRVRAHLLVPLDTGKPSDPDGRHHLASRLARVRRFKHPSHTLILGFLSRRLVRTSSFCIITERPEGHSLRRVLDMRGALSADVAINLVDRVADCIEAAHEHDLLHLSLTLENITVDPATLHTPKPTVKVLDLGLVEAMRGAAPRLALPLASRSTAPEVLRSGRIGARADVYTLGALLRALTSAPDQHPPTVLVELIQHATAMHPDARLPSVQAFRARLAAAAAAIASGNDEQTFVNKDPDSRNDQRAPSALPALPPLVPTARPAMERQARPPVHIANLDVPTLDIIPDRPGADQLSAGVRGRVRGTSWLWVLVAAIPFVVGALIIGALAWGGSFSRPTVEAGPWQQPGVQTGDNVRPIGQPER